MSKVLRLLVVFLVFSLLILFSVNILAEEKKQDKEHVKGSGFEMNIMLDTIVGYQRFSDAPVTEIAYDGSSGGVMGEMLSLQGTSIMKPNGNVLMFTVPKLEIDISKHFEDVVRLRADLSFGSPNIGSFVNGVLMNHAYVAVRPTKDRNIEILIGRFGLQAGYEPFRPFMNDTISWSIMWRGNLYPPGATGIQLSADLTRNFKFYFTAANGTINDSTFKFNTLPCFIATVEWDWGSDIRQNQVVITPYAGPESGWNKPLTYGIDATVVHWFGYKWKLGLEAMFQRDKKVSDTVGANTNYTSGLFNLRYQFTPDWYGVIKYVFARQSEAGNGVLNLTGAEQDIHESSIGFGYSLTDFAKIKGEFRIDVINPAYSAWQYIPGAAFEYTWFF